VLRALAALLAVVLVSAFVREAPQVECSDEMSVSAADHPGVPGEPKPDAPSKIATAVPLTIEPVVAPPEPRGLVHESPGGVGRGELHARALERPPRAVFLHA
jgi:hypothetical protein